jgi:hypothetical protein
MGSRDARTLNREAVHIVPARTLKHCCLLLPIILQNKVAFVDA